MVVNRQWETIFYRMEYIEKTKKWIEKVVIGLNLCPFAHAPFQKGTVRLTYSDTSDPAILMRTFLAETEALLSKPASELETTLIIHPNVLIDFEAYLDFYEEANLVLEEVGAEEVIQLASFHPDYCFEGEPASDPANFTNRSPYPMLHLLRFESVEKAIQLYPDVEGIPDRNIAQLRALGSAHFQQILSDL